jgi:hypothetical protein
MVDVYSVGPMVIAQLVESSVTGILVFVHHEFKSAYGSFAGDEATYQMVGPDQVQMSVRGNSHAYTHNNLSWMRNNGMRYVCNGVEKTLVWTQQGGSTLHTITMFATTTVKVELEKCILSTLHPLVRGNGYYGPVNVGGIFDEPDLCVEGDFLSLPKTSCYSWGDSMVVYQHASTTTVLCPKGLINAAAAWSVGQPRTATKFGTLLTYLRHKAKNLGVPQGNLDSALFACATLGFTRNIPFETGTMHTVFAPAMPLIETHTRALAFNFNAIRTWKSVVARVIAGLASTAVVASGVGVVAGAAAAVIVGAATVLGAGAYVAHKLSGPSGVGRGPPPTASVLAFSGYHTDRSSSPEITRVLHLPDGINLPATEPSEVTLAAVSAHGLAKGASFDIRDVTTTREIDNQGPLRPLGITSSMAIPIVPANSAASAVVAVHSRILKPSPSDRGLTDAKFLDLFEKWVMNPATLGSLGLEAVEPTTFDVWNSKYPPAQQLTHVAAMKDLNIGNFNERLVNSRGCFVKTEGLSKSHASGVSGFAPRAIQSGTPIHNVCTGPFFTAFSTALAKTWNVANPTGPIYTSGASAEQIGAAFRQAVEKNSGNLAILEGDFARFDSTIHRRLLEIEAAIYRYFGATPLTLHAVLAGIKTRGRDKWGNRYTVDGGRHSGDHNTSCGNTLIQGLAILFCLCFHHFEKHGEWLSYPDLCSKYQITLLLLGDDNLCIGDASILAEVPLKALLLKLGLELEPKLHSGEKAAMQATFCSARFWPCENEDGETVTVLGPPIGRCVAKSGWYTGITPNVDPRGLVRSDALGRIADVRFIPFINHLWQRTLDLTQGLQAKSTAAFAKEERFRTHTRQVYTLSPEAYTMVEEVYGLTAKHEQEYATLLASVNSLPAIVDYAPLRRAMIIDGVLADPEEIPLDGVALDTPPLWPEFDDLVDSAFHLPGLPTTPALRCIHCGKHDCVVEHVEPDGDHGTESDGFTNELA